MKNGNRRKTEKRRHFGAKRVISLILTLSLLFSLAAMPAQAAAANAPANAARELLGRIRDIMSGQEEYSPAAVAETDTASDGSTETKIASMRIETPEGLVVYECDENGEPVLVYDGRVEMIGSGAASGASGETEFTWSDFAPETVADFKEDGSLSEDCIMYFLLNNGKASSKGFAARDGRVIVFSGAKDHSYLADADHDCICDDCGRCIAGCTGDEVYYDENDVVKEEDGYCYNAEGIVVGRRVNTSVDYASADESGAESSYTEEQSFIQYYSYTDDADGKCNVCGTALCGDVNNGYIHDFSDGKCDICGRCVGGCVDLTGKIVDKTETGDGICDVCAEEMTEAVCEHQDRYGKDTCNTPDCGEKYCAHMTDIEISTASNYFSGAYKYLNTALAGYAEGPYRDALSAWLEGTLAKLTDPDDAVTKGIAYSKQVRSNIKLAILYGTSVLAYIDGLKDLDTDGLSGSILVGRLNSDGTLNIQGTYYESLKQRTEELEAQRLAALDEVKGYYPELGDTTGMIDSLAEKVLDRQLHAVFGSSYCNGPVGGLGKLSDDNIYELKKAVAAVDESLLFFLYGDSYRDASYTDTAEKIWSGSGGLYLWELADNKTQYCTAFKMLEYVTAKINSQRASAMSGFEQFTYNDGTGLYAVRPELSGDMTKASGEQHKVYEEQIQKVIKSLDAYISSPEFAKLASIALGIELEDADGSGDADLYDFVVTLLAQKLMTDELVSGVITNTFSTVTEFLDSVPDLLDSLSGVDYKGSGKYNVDIISIVGEKFLETGNWFAVLLDAFGFDATCVLDFNGGDARKLSTILPENDINILAPAQFAAAVEKFNSDGRYDAVCEKLRTAGTWDKVGTLPFGIDSAADVEEIVAILLASVEPLINVLFGSGTDLDLKGLAKFGLNVPIFGLMIFIKMNINIKAEFEGSRIYTDVIAPIFEALGVADFADGLNCSLNSVSFTDGDTVGNMKQAAEALLEPIATLIKQFSYHPLEKLLSMIPNIALNLENGKLLELLDMDMEYSLQAYDIAPSASEFGQGYLDMLENSLFPHWWDYANPIKWAQFLIATVNYWLMAGAVTLALKVIKEFGVEGLDLKSFAGILKINAGGLPGKMIKKVLEGLPATINKLLKPLGLQLDPKYKIDYKDFPELKTNGKELQNLNMYSYLYELLCGSNAQEALGFDLTKPSSIVKFVLERLYDLDGNKLFDSEATIEALDADRLGHLGVCEVKSGSVRSDYLSSRWGLDSGEYYYVEANTSDVLYYFVNVIAAFASSEQNLKGLLQLVGLSEDKLNELLDGLSKSIGFDIKSVLSQFTDEEGKLTLKSISENMSTDGLMCAMVEFMLSDGAYELRQLMYAQASADRRSDVEGRGGLPYLDYDNMWSEGMAKLLAEDIDDLADTLLRVLGIDLDSSTEEIETLTEYAKGLVAELAKSPDLMTALAELLVKLTTAEDGKPAELVELATGLEVSAWSNDFGYLFLDGAKAPEERYFTALRAEKTDDSIVWYVNGDRMDSLDEDFDALAELLRPLDPLFDLMLNGKSMEILPYTVKNGEVTSLDHLMTVTGVNGYNCVILPMLEAVLGSDDARLLTARELAAIGGAKSFFYCLELAADYLLDDVLGSDTPVADMMAAVAQLMYLMSENGPSVFTLDLMHPLWVVLDAVRPAADIDADEIVNGFICALCYKLGDYESPSTMRSVMKTQNAELCLSDMSLASMLNTLSVIISARRDGTRLFFDVSKVFESAAEDLACLSESTDSVSVKTCHGRLTDEPITAYRLNISGTDSMTVIVSMFAEMLLCGDNVYVLDKALRLKGLLTSLMSLLTDEPQYTADYNWAYIVGDDADRQAEFLAAVREKGSVSAADHRTDKDRENFNVYLESYDMTDWDEKTVAYLIESINDMITMLLNIDIGTGPLAELVLPAEMQKKENGHYTLDSLLSGVASGLLTDESIDKLILSVSELLDPKTEAEPSAFAELLPFIKDLLCAAGINVSLYDIDPSRTVYADGTVTYYGADGKATGLTRQMLSEDLSNLGEVLAGILTPVADVVAFVMLGKPIELFNASTDLVAPRGEALLRVNGFEGYNYIALPLLEAMGLKGLKPAADYISDGEYKTHEFLSDLMGSVADYILGISSCGSGEALLDKLFDAVPAVLYLVNSNGVGVAVQNLLARLEALFDAYNSAAEILSGFGLELNKLDLTAAKTMLKDMSLGDMMRTLLSWTVLSEKDTLGTAASSLIESVAALLSGKTPAEPKEGEHIVLSELVYELFDRFTVGEIVYNADSACSFDTYTMRFKDSKDKAAFLTIFISAVIDTVEDPANEAPLSALLTRGGYQSLINLMNLRDFEFDMKDIPWIFTEYANTDTLVSPFDRAEAFREEPVYGELWTKEMACEVADDLESFVSDLLYLLGLEINGVIVRDFKTLAHALAGGLLYTDDTVNAIAGILGQVKPYLDEYDPNGDIAGFIYELLGVDLHAWDEYAEGGRYADGRSWGFNTENLTAERVDENAQVFEDAIVELLAPAAQLISFVMVNRNFSFLVDGDGLGRHADEKIQLTVYGAEGYKYAIVPLFEAMGINTGDIYSPDEYSRRAVNDNEYAVRGIIHPLISFLGDLMDDTVQRSFELIPRMVYFMSSGGVGVMIENMLHSVYVMGNALKPLKDDISQLVYDEQGIFDLYNTLDLTGIVDGVLFDAFGIEKEDLIRIYNQSGGTYEQVDSFEDIDLRLIFSVALALVDAKLKDYGISIKLMPFVSDITAELSCGYVRSFTSLNGKTAYTMVLDRELNSECFGDLFTVLMRAFLKLLAQGENVEAVMQLINKSFKMDCIDYTVVKAVLKLATGYMASPRGIQMAMLTVYYTVNGASTVSGKAVKEYTKINHKWAAVMDRLSTENGGVAGDVLKLLISLAGDEVDGILSPTQIAPNGFVSFFKDSFGILAKLLITVRTTVTSIFKGIFRWR